VDGTTQKLRELSDEWRDVWGVADEEVAKRVREDGIDVLVDLSGHTGFNRLLVMAQQTCAARRFW
jgi:predicted O-linked N-acetylglucosamine transferase (SPINDLY family)